MLEDRHGLSLGTDCAAAADDAYVEGVDREVVGSGGSHAQRELFEDTLLGAYLRAGCFGVAERALPARLERRPLARDAVGLGRAREARAAPGRR
jgi:hypothetical protein